MIHAIFSLFLIASCSILQPRHKEPRLSSTEHKKLGVPPASIEAKQIAVKQKSNIVTEVRFAKSSASLLPEIRRALVEFSKKARANGRIRNIQVITLPGIFGNLLYLPADKNKLVDERNKALRAKPRIFDAGTEVKTFSMAQHPSELDNAREGI